MGKRADTGLFRMLDANVNRAVEGLRAAEDVLRFCLDDEVLFREVRALRHAVRETAGRLPGGFAALISARDSAGDVGGAIKPRDKTDAAGILRSNFQRAQEALRALEEASASVSGECSGEFARIRFRAYTLEKKIAGSAARLSAGKKRLPAAPFVYALAGAAELTAQNARLLRAVAAGGAGIVQLREKAMDDLHLLKAAAAVAKRLRRANALFFVNDRTDIALAAGADGVHLGDSDLPVAAARRIAPELLVGTSTHSLAQALRAAGEEPDYLAFGPIFDSPTKMVRPPVGLKTLEKVCSKVEVPVVAIGGITAENAAGVFAAGAVGAAMVSAITNSRDPRGYIEGILKRAGGSGNE